MSPWKGVVGEGMDISQVRAKRPRTSEKLEKLQGTLHFTDGRRGLQEAP